jgi:hypothetical protein
MSILRNIILAETFFGIFFILITQTTCHGQERVVWCREFDFIKFKCGQIIDDTSDYDTYYGIVYNKDNDVTTIRKFDKIHKLNNYEFEIETVEQEKIHFINGKLFVNHSHSLENSIPLQGVFVLDKNREELFLFRSEGLFKQSANLDGLLKEIECVFQLDENLYPLKKVVFSNGYFLYKTEFDYSKNEVFERMYLFDNEHCNSKNIHFNSLSQLANVYFYSDCDFILGEVKPIVPDIDIPIWIFPKYLYGIN